MNDSTPFLTAALFLIFCGWLAIALGGCADKPTPVEFCLGSPDTGVEGPVQTTEAYIVNGTESTDRRGTVIVANSEGYCSGTTIGPHTVLTAAHCTGNNEVVEVVRGVTGKLQATSLTHPDYVTYPNDDIALFYVEETLPEPYIKLYSLEYSEECAGFIAQGYGQGSGGRLHEKPYEVRHVGWKLLVTKGDDGGTCFGDSGGPLYAIVDGEPYLAGSLSTGWDYECYAGGHHVRIDAYTDWIQENIR